MADWKDGVLDVIDGDVAGGVADQRVAIAAERDGLRVHRGVELPRRGADGGDRRWTIRKRGIGCRVGVRYADSIEQSHCAHVMRATSALTSLGGG